MEKIKQFFMPLLLMLIVSLGISPHTEGQTGTDVLTVTPGTGTWVVPPGVNTVTVKLWGAGGGGGNAIGPNASDGQGGGGGGAFQKVNVSLTRPPFGPIAFGAVAVGVGGTAGNGGTQSNFALGLIAASGGSGSNTGNGFGGIGGLQTPFPLGPSGSVVINSSSASNGGDGGASSNPLQTSFGGGGGGRADDGINGGDGTNGGTSGSGAPGVGGSVGGGNGGVTGGAGPNAISYGGGGGGRGFNGVTSGTGGDGRIEITWICPTLTSVSYPSPTVCSYSSALNPTILPATAVGGTFSSATLTGFLNTASGVIATGAPQGTHIITYGWPAFGGCPAASVSFTLTIAPQAVITSLSYAGSPYCSNAGTVSPTLVATGATGTYSSTAGLSINATTGAINTGTSTPGTYTVTYTVAASGNCLAVTATTSVTITALPTITGFDYPGDNTYCAGEGIQTPLSTITNPNSNPVSYSYTTSPGLSLNTSTGAINPATSTPGVYIVSVTVAAGGGCAAVTATSTVEILARPTAVISYAGNPFCQTVASTTQAVTIGTTTGGPVTVDWSANPATLIINSATGAIDLSSPVGIYTVKYRFTGVNGCLDSSTTSVTIKARPTSTITTTGSPLTTCSNVDPTIGGLVTATGAWTLTLSNGQTATGTGTGPWSITINTQLPGTTVTYTVTSLVDANNCPAAPVDRPGSYTVIQKGLTAANIDGAANVYICTGQDANVLVELSGALAAPSPSYTGTFQIDVWNGAAWVPSSPATLSWAVTFPVASGGNVIVPAGFLPNTTLSITKQYRVRWGTMFDGDGCPASPLTGFVYIFVAPNPQITVSAAPVADVCPGTNLTFTVNQTGNVVGALFNWVAIDAANNVLGQAYNVPFGTNAINTNLGLSCPTTHTNPITFTISPIGPSPYNCGGAPITRVVNVRDIVAPTWTTVAANLNRTVQCNDAVALAAANALFPVAADNCDNDVTNIVKTSGAFVSNGAPCTQSGSYTNTWVVTDDCGNTSLMYTQVITVIDNTAPVLTGTIPAGQTGINNCLSNAPTPPTAATIAAQFTDNCGTVSATLASVTTGTDCGWTVTHTYTVKDNCGNTVAVSPVIVYSGADLTAPTLIVAGSFPAGQTGINNCLANAPTGATIAAVAALYSDNCGGAITVVKTTVTTGTDCAWTVTYTFSIKDKCGNEVTPKPTQVFSGGDATAPTIGTNTFPAGQTGINNCLANAPTGATEAAIAALYSDNCGGAITVVKTSVTTGTDCAWTVTYTFSIKDKCGNEVTPKPTQVFSGGDATAPTIGTNTFPAGQTGINNCLANAPTGATEAAVAALYSDNCGGAITVVKTTVTTGTDCAWTVTYTYSIKDKCGNEVTPKPTQVFTGGDLTAPTLIVAGSFPVGNTVSINGCIGSAPVGPTAAAIQALYQDACGGAITVVKTGAPTGTDCAWTVTYTYSIKDKCGNEVTPKPTVTYFGADATAPVITNVVPTQTLNTGAGVNCGVPMPDYRSLVTATDCGTFTLAQLAPNAPGTMVFGFNGSRTVVIEATDACGNKSQTSFSVLLKDLTAPNAICKPYTLILNANGTGTIVVANVNNGSFDNCTPTPSLVYALSQTNFTCANVGPNNVTLSVTDLCGNVGTCTAVVTVVDNTAPVIECFGDTIINKDANCTYTVPNFTFRVTKADACGIASVTQSIPVGTIFGASITSMPITLTVTDVNGNSSTCTFNITFRDVTPPVISGCPGNITVFTGLGRTTCNQVATWIPPTATDACLHLANQTQPITGNFAPGATFPVGVTTVTYTATDVAGNTSTCSFTVTVVDNTAPVITGCPGNISVNTGAGRTTCDQTATWTEPTATDNCTAVGSLIRTRSHAPGTVFPVGTTTVTYTFADAAGNISLPCSFTVTVVDNTVPIITCPGNIANPPINTAGCLATVSTANPTFSDNCGVTKLTWAITGAGIVPAATSPTTGINYLGSRTFNFGVTTVTYTATDAAGNTATCSFTVSVTRPFTAAISGTGTVLQNNTGTSNVSFTSQLGTAPYTIVYTTTAGGYPTAGTHTIVTSTGGGGNSSTIGGNPNWLVTTVPQSSATPGVYTYTLVSVTDAFGCVVTPNTTAVVTVINTNYPAPDLTPSIASGSTLLLPAATKTGYLQVFNSPNLANNNNTSGIVEFEVYNPSNFTLSIAPGTSTVGSTAVDNNQFDIVYYPGVGYAVQTKPGVVIPANGSLKVGYTITSSGSANNQGQLIVNISNQTGGIITAVGDSNDGNNNALKTFKIIN
jgi:HYR domain